MAGRRVAVAALLAIFTLSPPGASVGVPISGSLAVDRPFEISGAVLIEPAHGYFEAIARWPDPRLDGPTPMMVAERAVMRIETWAQGAAPGEATLRGDLPSRLGVENPLGGSTFVATNATLRGLSAGPAAQWRAWDVSLGSKGPGHLETTGAHCDVWDPSFDMEHTFPDDPDELVTGKPVKWSGNTSYLAASCDVEAARMTEPLVVSFYGIELQLESDEGPQVIQTGTSNEEINGVRTGRRISQVLHVQFAGEALRFDLEGGTRLDLYARAFGAIGDLAVSTGHGHLDLPGQRLDGEIEPFRATGTFRLAWGPEAHVAIEGQAVDATGIQILQSTAQPVTTAPIVAAAAGALVLVAWLAWLFYCKLLPHQALAHPRRRQILAHVRDQPGSGISEVARVLRAPWPLAAHHVATLVRAGHLFSTRVGRRIALFPAKAGYAPRAAAVTLLRRGTHRAIHGLLTAKPGLDQEALAVRLGLTQARVSQTLGQLRSAGLVRVERDGRRQAYFAQPYNASLTSSEGSA